MRKGLQHNAAVLCACPCNTMKENYYRTITVDQNTLEILCRERDKQTLACAYYDEYYTVNTVQDAEEGGHMDSGRLEPKGDGICCSYSICLARSASSGAIRPRPCPALLPSAFSVP